MVAACAPSLSASLSIYQLREGCIKEVHGRRGHGDAWLHMPKTPLSDDFDFGLCSTCCEYGIQATHRHRGLNIPASCNKYALRSWYR